MKQVLITQLPNNLIENDTFLPCNSPNKNDIALNESDGLAFDETIVVEPKFSTNKIFFTSLYRSPAFKVGSLEFQKILDNFNNLFNNVKN